MTQEQDYWKLVEDANWKSDHSYKRILNEWLKLPEDTFEELKKFIDKKASMLYKKYGPAWLGQDGGPGINASDDSWNDLIHDVIGRGEHFYNTVTVEKLREMADNYDYKESFAYCLLK